MNTVIRFLTVLFAIVGATMLLTGTIGVGLYGLVELMNGVPVQSIMAKTERITVVFSSAGTGFLMMSLMTFLWRE